MAKSRGAAANASSAISSLFKPRKSRNSESSTMTSNETNTTADHNNSETADTAADNPPTDARGTVRFDDYAAAAKQPADPSKATKYRARRLALTVNIPEVDNNVDRLAHLATEVNEFIKVARKGNSKFRLRKIQDTSSPQYEEILADHHTQRLHHRLPSICLRVFFIHFPKRRRVSPPH